MPEDVAEGAGAVVTIGKPLADYRMYVLDSARRAVPQGAAGDLYIAGPALAKEYFRRPELTAESFSGAGTERMYRTGDLARYRPDGNQRPAETRRDPGTAPGGSGVAACPEGRPITTGN